MHFLDALIYSPPPHRRTKGLPFFSHPSSSISSILPSLITSNLSQPPTPLSSKRYNPWMDQFLQHSALVYLTGSIRRAFSPTKDAFTFPLIPLFNRPSLFTATIMRLLATQVTLKPANLSPQNFGGPASHLSCANTLRDVQFANKTSPTHIPPFHPSPPFAPPPLDCSNKSLVTLSQISHFPRASIHFWSWSTMALLRG